MGMRTDKTKVEMFECNTQPHFFKNKCLKARGQAQQWKSDDLGFFFCSHSPGPVTEQRMNYSELRSDSLSRVKIRSTTAQKYKQNI